MGQFSKEDKLFLLKTARESIQSHLDGRQVHPPKVSQANFLEKRGAFVTLHINGQLRGCIGHPLPVDRLINSVVGNAVSAAFEDHRFPPLTHQEFGDVDLEISVLTVPEKIKNVEDINVGQDGIIVGKGFNRGLLLPQVPVEQKWDLEEYISYGCLKAGLPRDEWRKGVDVETFQAEVFGELELSGGSDGSD